MYYWSWQNQDFWLRFGAEEMDMKKEEASLRKKEVVMKKERWLWNEFWSFGISIFFLVSLHGYKRHADFFCLFAWE